MRALVALVTAVILLAIVQGSYLVIDAHHNGYNVHVTDDADQEDYGKITHHASHSQSNHKHQSNHHNHLQPIQKTEGNPSNHGNRGILSQDGLMEDKVESLRSGCHGDKCINSNPHLKDTEIELVPLPGSPANQSSGHRILYQTLNDKQQTGDKGEGQEGHKHEGQGHHHNHSHHHLRLQKSNVQAMSKDTDTKTYMPQGDRLLIDMMQGDMPVAESKTENHVLLDDPVRHQRDKNKSRGKRQQCLTHDDCDQGDCCLTRRKGPAYCATTKKEAGTRCVDSCTCQEGLECFVAKVNRFGRPRRRNGRHPLLGVCQDPNEPPTLPGYWATYKPRGETTTLRMTSPPSSTSTPRTIPTTSTGAPYTRRSRFIW